MRGQKEIGRDPVLGRRIEAHRALRGLLEDRQLLLGPLGADALREAMARPAIEVGAFLEKGLVQIILRDVEQQPGALPLMQHALDELWRARQGPWLTHEAYEASGGVRAALRRRAQRTFDGLSPQRQTLARDILLRLSALAEGAIDTLRRVPRLELYVSGHSPPEVDAVIEALSSREARLVVAHGDSVEIAHEALIREWDTLRRWLRESRTALRIHRQLTQAARDWRQHQKDESYLYRGARQAEVEAQVAESRIALNAAEHEFLEASVEQSDREKREEDRRRERELESARKLAETERRRAEEAETRRREAEHLTRLAKAQRLALEANSR